MRKRHQDPLPLSEQFDLNQEVSQGLIAIILFMVAGLSVLSFFSLAGVAGQFIDSLLAIMFGQVRYVFPILLIVVAYLIIKNLDYEYRSTQLIGAVLFCLSFNGIVHLQKPATELVDLALQGYGGGISGLAFSWPIAHYVGYPGGMLLLFGLLLISIICIFNTTLTQIVMLHKKLFLALGWVGIQIISFFAQFRRTPKLHIAGEFQPVPLPTDDDTEDEEPRFERRSLTPSTAQHSEDEEDTAEEEVKEDLNTPIQVTRAKPIIRELPPLDLLNSTKDKPTSGDIEKNATIIKETLHNFGIEVEMGEIRVGPTVTQFSFKPAKGIKLSRITALNNDLALALAAHPLRIEAPIPGQALVGIEVPNQKVAMVTLRELLSGPEFKNREHNLLIALGKDVAGKVWFGDLPKMPHLLIAGATGSGKTVCINTVILSLLFQNTAATLRMIMVDPKRVELTLYNGIPHLLTPVITDPQKTVNALRWTITEMERRFDVLAAAGKRDIGSYNKTAADPLPFIVFVIDELADLMATAASEVEAGIIRIAQMARAVGIHLIVATQRPSVEVITGLMKANIPARIAFSVASLIDSRTILDCSGAEQLIGRGDMLFLTADLAKPKRVQGAYVSEEEMKRVVEHLKGDEPPTYDETIVNKNAGQGGTASMFGGPNDDQDPLFLEAKKVVLESGKASASLLQRRMRVGYARAARLLDELEEAGVVGQADGARPREVFTEHLRETDDSDAEDQTMDAGGTVFAPPTPKEQIADTETNEYTENNSDTP